jgi:VanZ family protein
VPHRSSFAFIAWLIFCTVLLTLPGSAFPSENWMGKLQLDKWIHIFLFSMMAFFLCWSVYKTNRKHPEKNKRYFIIAGLICIAYGIAMEYVQKYYVPNRSFDVGDIIADAVGAVAGTVFSMSRYIKK